MSNHANTLDLEWRPYDLTDGEHVVGDVRVSNEVDSPLLESSRRVVAYLPPSYETGERQYPVVYMHDGQNLFDEATSYSGEWRVDETMERLATDGYEAIVIGVPNAGDDRRLEYTPWPHSEYGGGGADDYLEWLLASLKPAVDATLRTKPERETTGLAGSSLGGLVSLYGYFEYPERVGCVGVLSPAFWWNDEAWFDYLEAQPSRSGRIYMDVGDSESLEDDDLNAAYLEDAKATAALLESNRHEPSLRFRVDEGGRHRETAWARRFPAAVQFLLP